MCLARFTAALLAFLFVLAPEIGSRGPAATRRSAMVFRDFAEMDGAFVVIRGGLGPAEFFKGLHSVERKGQTVVLNDEGEVQFFPDRVTITLLFLGPIPKAHEETSLPSFDPQYMKDLQFKAEWKRGVEMRSVKRFSVLTASASQPPQQPQLDLLFPFPVFRECWIYEFVIEDSEVPIDDHLILYVISPDNKRLARLSAHL
jgi:hypothetical protein